MTRLYGIDYAVYGNEIGKTVSFIVRMMGSKESSI